MEPEGVIKASVVSPSLRATSHPPRAPSYRPKQNPLIACLGRARVGNQWVTVSPYSPCCFQELSRHSSSSIAILCRVLQNFPLTQNSEKSVCDRWRTRRHQLRKPVILAQSGELLVLVDAVNALVPFFHCPPQVLQRSLRDPHLGVQLGHYVVVVRAVFWFRHLRSHAGSRGSLKHIGVKLQSMCIRRRRFLKFLFREQRRTQVAVIGSCIIAIADCLVVAIDGFAVLLPDVKNHPEIVIRIRILPVGSYGLLKTFLCVRPPLHEQFDNSHFVVKNRAVRLLGQRRAIVVERIQVELLRAQGISPLLQGLRRRIARRRLYVSYRRDRLYLISMCFGRTKTGSAESGKGKRQQQREDPGSSRRTGITSWSPAG